MKKHMTLFAVLGGVVVILLLAVWGLWSFEIYSTANKYASDLTKAWRDRTEAEDQWSVWVKRARKSDEDAKNKSALAAKYLAELEELKASIASTTAPVASATPVPAVPAAPAAPVVPATPAPSAPAPAAPPVKMVAAKEIPEALKIAIVGKGQGPQHSLIRQLIANPLKYKFKGDLEKWNFKGDVNDKKAVKEWAGGAAHVIAGFSGYVNFKTGEEIRVREPDAVAYVIVTENDGTVEEIREHGKDKEGNFQITPEVTKLQKLAKSYDEIKFKASVGAGVEGGVQLYEYLWSPLKD